MLCILSNGAYCFGFGFCLVASDIRCYFNKFVNLCGVGYSLSLVGCEALKLNSDNE